MEIQLTTRGLETGLIVENAAGHRVRLDAGAVAGGTDAHFRPMQLLLGCLLSCSSIDVMHILQKQKQTPEQLQATATAERAPDPPKVFTKIHLVFTAAGGRTQQPHLERAVRLSVEKYCSVAAMLQHTADITFEARMQPH